MSELASRVEQAVVEKRLLAAGDRLLLAVSGGLDSVALLHLLDDLSGRWRWALTVAHFNHQLRGPNSDADAAFVLTLARSLELPCKLGSGNVRQLAKRHKLSLEMAARQLRHRFLARTAARLKIRKVLLAHHADDQVELFFLRLLRGTGSEGLGGMRFCAPSPADSDVILVRPLLEVTREELEQFVIEKKLSFREDKSNAQRDFQRNRIRNELLPLLRANYQPALNRTVLRAMEIFRADADYVAAQARAARANGNAPFESLPVAVQRRWLIAECEMLGFAPPFDCIERLRSRAGEEWTVSPRRVIWRDAGGRVHSRSVAPRSFKTEETWVKLGSRGGHTVFGNLAVDWKIHRGVGQIELKRELGREVFDADRIGESIRLRHWRPGDRFWPIGMMGSVKLQDLFTNQRIAASERRELVMAETATGMLFWVEGLRIAEQVKMESTTVRCLEWRWMRER